MSQEDAFLAPHWQVQWDLQWKKKTYGVKEENIYF